jgi:hypothetical protein
VAIGAMKREGISDADIDLMVRNAGRPPQAGGRRG